MCLELREGMERWEIMSEGSPKAKYLEKTWKKIVLKKVLYLMA